MKTSIIVKLQVEGVHCWPDCDIEEVSFLKQPHRHIFHIACKKEVRHDDRDIEIIQFKHRIHDYLRAKYSNGNMCEFGAMSCEMLARELMQFFGLCYCSVLEDNENGAEIVA